MQQQVFLVIIAKTKEKKTRINGRQDRPQQQIIIVRCTHIHANVCVYSML